MENQYYCLDIKKLSKPQPLINSGSNCWLNSMIQMITTLTSISDLLAEIEQTKKSKSLSIINTTQELPLWSPTTKLYHQYITKNNDLPGFLMELQYIFKTNEQQCVAEYLTLILDLFGSPVNKLFAISYEVKTYCKKCDKILYFPRDNHHYIELYDILSTNKLIPAEKLADYLIKYKLPLSNYHCDKCKSQIPEITYQLRQLSEILIIVLNKFTTKYDYAFPEYLTFPTHDDNTMKYKLVAQILHHGTQQSGHYSLNCIRSADSIVKINDSVVNLSTFSHDPNTFILAYHLI